MKKTYITPTIAGDSKNVFEKNGILDISEIVSNRRKKRTRKVSFAIPEEVYQKARVKCDQIEISFSEAINQLLEQWIK